MRLANATRLAVHGNRGLKEKIRQLLDVSEYTVLKLVRENDDDGDLTKVSVLKLISDETGIPEDRLLEKATA